MPDCDISEMSDVMFGMTSDTNAEISMPPVVFHSHRLDLGTLITWLVVTMAIYTWKQCKRLRQLHILLHMNLPSSIGPAMDLFPLLSA